MSKRRIVSNLIIMATGQMATWLISLAGITLKGRYLGPGRLGELTLAESIVAVLGLMVTLGMDTLIIRTVARAPESASRLASAAMIVRAGLTVPVLIVLYLYAHVAHLNAETRVAAYIIAVGMVVGSLGTSLVSTFQGREQMSLSTLSAVAQNGLGLILIGLIMWLHGGVIAFAIGNVVLVLLLLALNMRWVRRFARLTWRVSLQDIRELVVGSLAFAVRDVFFTIYLYIDAVILGTLAGSRAVGYYAPATRMLSVAMFLIGIIGPATLPLLSRLGIDAGTDFARVGRKTLSLFIVCGVPITIGLATFATPLILLVFGPAYRPAVPVLVVLSLSILPTFVNYQFSQMLTARDQQWRWTAALAASCVVNPLMNLAFIPFAAQHWHNAALGAALAFLLTELLQVCYGTIFFHDVLFDRSLGRIIAGALAAGAAQAVVLWLAIALWPPLSEVLGMAIYGAVAIALGAVPREDAALLYEMLTHLIRRLFWWRVTQPAPAIEPAAPRPREG